MQRQDVGSSRLLGRLRVRRTDRVVAAEPLLLDAGQPDLVAVVDRRRPAHAAQHHEGVREVSRVLEPARDPRDIVVADEGQRHERPQVAGVPVERGGQLEEVRVVQRRPDRLPQLVLRHRVHPRLAHHRGVVAVDHLADEIRLGVSGPDPAEHVRPEVGRDGVRRVEPPAVGAPVEPVAHHVHDQVAHPRRGVVEPQQRVVALEDVEPRLSLRVGAAHDVPVLDRTGAGVEVPADVVEHAVEQHPEAAVVGLADEGVEVLVGAEPAVDPTVVGGVVAVRRRLEDRTERDAGGAQRHRVVEPADEVGEPPPTRPVGAGGVGSGEAEGVDLPPDGVAHPVGLRHVGDHLCRRGSSRRGGVERASEPLVRFELTTFRLQGECSTG